MALFSSSGSELRRSADEGPDWSELPPDLTLTILGKLGPAELLEKVPMVCRTWRNISRDPSLWRSIDSSRFGFNITWMARDKMMRRAVDLSCGQLVDVRLEGYETLKYIADRLSQLRRLVIHSCQPSDLMDVVSSLPLLEELHAVSVWPSVTLIETIGSHCQQLKSFTLVKEQDLILKGATNEEALAIGRSMHELRQLSVDGVRVTEFGVKAILDGCPRLESLVLFGGRSNLVKSLAERYPAIRIECVPYPRTRRLLDYILPDA